VNIKFRIWLRTLKFVAFNWALPFFVGVVTALLIDANASLELAAALAQACKQSL